MCLEHLPWLHRVALGLRHLLAFLVEDQAKAHHVAVRRRLAQQRRDRQQRVEPSARLVLRLAYEIGRKALAEALGVLEREVVLGERHRPGVEPHVDHLRHAGHGAPAATPLRALPPLVLVRALELHAVDERTVVVGQRRPRELGELRE